MKSAASITMAPAPIRPVAVYGNAIAKETNEQSSVQIGNIGAKKASVNISSNISSGKTTNIISSDIGNHSSRSSSSSSAVLNLSSVSNSGVNGSRTTRIDSLELSDGELGMTGSGSHVIGATESEEHASAFRPKAPTGKKYPQLGQGPLTKKYSESEDEGEKDGSKHAPGKSSG